MTIQTVNDILTEAAPVKATPKNLENLKPDDRLILFHGTSLQGFEEMKDGIDATRPHRRLYGSGKDKGIYVTNSFRTAKTFAGNDQIILELALRAKNLHGTGWGGAVRGKEADEAWRELHPTSFRPSLTAGLIGGGTEPQARYMGLIKPKDILAVWVKGKRYSLNDAVKEIGIKRFGVDISSPKLSLDDFIRAFIKYMGKTSNDSEEWALHRFAILIKNGGEQALYEYLTWRDGGFRIGMPEKAARSIIKKIQVRLKEEDVQVNDSFKEVAEELLSEMSRGEFNQQCNKFFDEITKKYWPQYIGKLQRPKFKMEGRDKEGGSYTMLSNILTINSDVTNDDKAFKSVFTHELVHYYDAMINHQKMDRKNAGHDTYFNSMANTINQKEGETVVQRFWQKSQMGKASKPFVVYIVEIENDKYAYFWSPKRNNTLIARSLKAIAKHLKSDQTYVGQSTNGILHRGARGNATSRSIGFELVDSKNNSDVLNDIRKIAITANRVNIDEVEPEKKAEEKDHYIYLMTQKNSTPDSPIAYFWNAKNNPKLYPVFNSLKKSIFFKDESKEPQFWVIKSDDIRIVRTLSQLRSASTKIRIGQNYTMGHMKEIQSLFDRLTPSHEINPKDTIPKVEKVYAYFMINTQKGRAAGFWSLKPMKREAEASARYHEFAEVYEVEDPPDLVQQIFPKANKSMKLGTVSFGNAFFRDTIAPLLSPQKLCCKISEDILKDYHDLEEETMTVEQLVTAELELHVYDFDGTLIVEPTHDSTEPMISFGLRPDNGGKETKPYDGNQPVTWIKHVVQAARRSIQKPNVHAVLLTGRSEKDRQRVEQLLKKMDLHFQEVMLNPGMDASVWKTKAVRKLLNRELFKHFVCWENDSVNLRLLANLAAEFEIEFYPKTISVLPNKMQESRDVTLYHGTTEKAAQTILRSGLDAKATTRTHNFQTVASFCANTPDFARLYGPVVVALHVKPGAKTKTIKMRNLFIKGKNLMDSIEDRLPGWKKQGLDIIYVPDQQSGVGNIILNPRVLEPIEIIGDSSKRF